MKVCVYDSICGCVYQERETLHTESEEAIKQSRITEREQETQISDGRSWKTSADTSEGM